MASKILSGLLTRLGNIPAYCRIICILLSLTLIVGLGGCRNSDAPTDTPTTGALTVAVDESLKPLIDAQCAAFHSIYKYADVSVIYGTEEEAFAALWQDSVRLIIVARNLDSSETAIFQKLEIVPKIAKIAFDAVAVIGSRDITDSTYTLAELKQLIESGKNGASSPKIVFDNNSSGTMLYIKRKLQLTGFSKNCFALNSNEQVINYVNYGKNTLGIIGSSWISDKDDTASIKFLDSIRVMEVAASDTSEPVKPYQAYIALKTYPLYREVYAISREAYTGLSTGFTSFLASERGQRIVLKSGLVPATMPVRLVKIINEIPFE